MEITKNKGNTLSENPEMDSLKQSLVYEFHDVKFFKEWPASKPDDKKTNVVWKHENKYIKGFTKTWKILWETEHRLIELFNQFSKENNSRFSWPTVLKDGEIGDGWYYFLMKDVKEWGLEQLDLSKMSPEEIMELYSKYRQTFDDFEKYSKWKTSTKSKIQSMYSLYNRFLHPEELSQSATITSKIINWVKKSVFSVLQPAFKLAALKNYKNKINERISNGQGNVRSCGVDTDREKINTTLNRLLSKVKNLDFEYNFWSFWKRHVFSDWTNHKFVDFDNINYQIKGAELIGIIWSNLLMSAWDYNSYDERKNNYDVRYKKLLETYEDENLVKLLLFIKLVWTVFEDYGNLIYKEEVWNKNKWQEKKNNFEKIRKWVQYNHRALQELMKEN